MGFCLGFLVASSKIPFLSREPINKVFLLFSNKTLLQTIILTVEGFFFSFYENSDCKLLRVKMLGKAYSI